MENIQKGKLYSINKEKEQYIDHLFSQFVDNKLSCEELDSELKTVGYYLPTDFFELSKPKQKKYRTHTMIKIDLTSGSTKIYEYEIFNKIYFYELVNKARKTKWQTLKLINYVKEFGWNETNHFFFALHHIRLQFTPFYKYKNLKDFIVNNNLKTVYDLLIYVFSMEQSIGKPQLENAIYTLFKEESIFDFDLKDPFNEFALRMECLLALLPTKEANTIKIMYSILTNNELIAKDYYQNKEIQKRILLHFKKLSQDKERLVNNIYKYIKNNQSYFSNMKPNGYLALYYSLIEEGYGDGL